MSYKELITGMLGVILLSITSCGGYLDTYPLSSLDKNSVFQSDRTAEAAVLGLYGELNNTVTYNGGAASLGYLTALSADELTNYYSFPPLGIERGQFEENNLQPTNSLVAPLWSDPYHFIYRCNELLEQVLDNNALSPELSKRITGEAAFMRAFHYFYLVNLFGRVPLILTTDFRDNLAVARSSIDSV